ncbi:outer membrane channel protein TolC [Pseudaeromonas sp. ZJS20]|uniref:outer membrane channel protein TolC n=1 Tax=Pseudaeromonas aegiceratis TaxID=3153928 RepID=UPI00390C5437
MKKTLISILVLLGTSGLAHADNLLDIYHLAQQKDPQLLESKAVRDRAFEAINETDAARLPQINLGATTGYRKTDKHDANTAATLGGNLGLSQSLYRRSNWINSDISSKVATQADVAYNAEQQGLMVRSAQAYFAVLSAQDTLEFSKANREALKRQLDETQQRYEVGMSAITDVHEAKAAFDLAEANVIVAENALSNSYEGLRQLTGMEHKFLDILNTDRFATSPLELDADHWMKLAEDSNLSLHRQRIAKEIAKQQIDLAQTGHEPTLDLSAGLSSAYTNYEWNRGTYQDGTLNTASVGLSFNLPLYQGGAVESRVKQAQFNYVAASESLEKTFRDVQATLNRNYNDVNGSIGTVRAYQQSVISAESALTATRAGYEVGTRTVVDLLDATRNLYSAKQQLSTARYNYILNRLAIKQTAGTLTEDDLVSVNQGLKPAA